MSTHFSYPTSEKVNVGALAKLTGLAASTLNKLRLTGEGPPYLKLGRRVVYDVAAVNEWMASKTRRSTSQSI